jgi:hypothetical protein
VAVRAISTGPARSRSWNPSYATKTMVRSVTA